MATKLTTAQRSKIAKAAWRKRKKGNPVAKRKTATPAKRKRKYTRRRGGLSELVTAVQAQSGVKAVGLGALGGGLASLAEKVFKPEMAENQKIMWLGVGAFGLATIGKAPYMAAGVAGVVGYKLMTEVGLSEGHTKYTDPIEQLPAVLDANGQPMRLAEDGDGNVYLEEDDNLYLDENGNEIDYQVDYAPAFSGEWDEHEWEEVAQ